MLKVCKVLKIKVFCLPKKEPILNCLKQVVSNYNLTLCSNLLFVRNLHNASLWSSLAAREQHILWPVLKHCSCRWGQEEFGLCCWHVKKTPFSTLRK